MRLCAESLQFFMAGTQRANGGNMRKRLIWLVMALALVVPASAGPISVNLGSASTFGFLGGTVGNTGDSVVTGNVGAMVTITGFPPGIATGGGTVFTTTGGVFVTAAYNAFVSAFNNALLLSTIAPDATLCPDGNLTNSCKFMYDPNHAYQLSGTDVSTSPGGINVTFDANGNPNAVFVIRVDGAFTENGLMTFTLDNKARADHIFWIIQNDATISIGKAPAINWDGNILVGGNFTMSAGEAGSGVLAGTLNGCVFAETVDKLAAFTKVMGCADYATFIPPGEVPEPGSLGLVSLGCLLGILVARRKLRVSL